MSTRIRLACAVALVGGAIIGCGLLGNVALSGAMAQTTTAGYEVRVEAARPRMNIHALSKDEQSAVRRALGGRGEAGLAALKPFAEAGDIGAIRKMMDGYMSLRKSASDKRAKGAPMSSDEQSYTALQGLWAMALWRQGVTDREVAKALDVCLKGESKLDASDQMFDYHKSLGSIFSLTKEYDCGFDTRGTIPAQGRLLDYARKNELANQYKNSPWTITFSERPLLGQGEVESERFAKLMDSYRYAESHGQYKNEAELKWAATYTAAHPDAKAKWTRLLFDVQLDELANGASPPAQGDWFWAYMESDPARQQDYQSALVSWSNKKSSDRRKFSETIAAAKPEDRDALAIIAKREGGDLARAWWDRYQSTVSAWYDYQKWCDAGIREACGPAMDALRLAQDREKDAPAEYTGSFAASGNPADATQSLKDYNKGVNTANCARADLGANISCNH